MRKLTENQEAFIEVVRKEFGEVNQITRKQILEIVEKYKLTEPQWLTVNPKYRISRGVYSLDRNRTITMKVAPPSVPCAATNIATSISMSLPLEDSKQVNNTTSTGGEYKNMVPERDYSFVKFGIYSDLKAIIASGIYYPVFISGLSGNGKSFTPEQICAELKREFFRVNITKNTNEDDLLGGFRLINGETVWWDGPVVQAAERGAILLLDEIDYGSAEISCLQNVLEGKAFLIKKVNKIVVPKVGFNIIATANTKGQGDNSGKFMFTNVLNEAFLERFSVTLEQEYPPRDVERKILYNNIIGDNKEEKVIDFANKLVDWAGANRITFQKGGIDEVLSTRRLVHIMKAYSMFNDKEKAVKLCLNRFSNEVSGSLFDLWMKIDVEAPENVATLQVNSNNDPNDPPDFTKVPF